MTHYYSGWFKRFVVSLVAFFLATVISVNRGAQAQEVVQTTNPHTPVSSDGSVVATEASAELRGVSPFEGTGDMSEVAEVIESEAEFQALLARKPATGGVGIETIIGTDDRVKVDPTTTFPARAVGLITFTQGTGNFTCTGWLIGKNTVATAGHCVHSGGSSGIWSTSVKFFPGRNGTSSPFGSCGAKSLHSVTGWTNDNDERFDYGVIKLDCNKGNTVGWFGFWWQAASLTGLKSTINGYPGDKPSEQWQSTDQVRVTETRQVFYKNDTVGGMSGGPVYQNRPKGSKFCKGNCSMAIHAYGLHGLAPHSDHNHGTRITQEVFNNLVQWKNKK